MSEPFYQFKLVPTADTALSDTLNALGRDGWHIAGIDGGLVFLQRLVQEDAPEALAPDYVSPPDEETVDPLCGCGCGDSVVIGISAWKMAIDRGMVWFISGHGVEADKHNGPYMAAPRRPAPKAKPEA